MSRSSNRALLVESLSLSRSISFSTSRIDDDEGLGLLLSWVARLDRLRGRGEWPSRSLILKALVWYSG